MVPVSETSIGAHPYAMHLEWCCFAVRLGVAPKGWGHNELLMGTLCESDVMSCACTPMDCTTNRSNCVPQAGWQEVDSWGHRCGDALLSEISVEVCAL